MNAFAWINQHKKVFLALLAFCLSESASYNDGIEGYTDPACIDAPAVAIYQEKLSDSDETEAKFLGCGVLATTKCGGERRYFILTARHVLMKAIGSKALQIGVLVKNDKTKIKRLRANPGTIIWINPDLNHDVVFGDITNMIVPMADQGVEAVCIDLDESTFCSSGADGRILPNLGIAPMEHYSYLGIGKDSCVTVVCSDPGKTFLSDGLSREWSSPFVRKEGVCGDGLVERCFIYRSDEGSEAANGQDLVVYQLLGDIIEGNSGAPIYFKGVNGQYYFAGIVTGFAGGSVFYMTPYDFIIECVKAVYDCDVSESNR